jgi:hypothetical protein
MGKQEIHGGFWLEILMRPGHFDDFGVDERAVFKMD